MSWEHEEPFEEEGADGPAPACPLVNGNHEAGKAPAVPPCLFGPLPGPPSPVASNHDQASDALNPSQQRPPAKVDSAELENGDDAERSSSTSDSTPQVGFNRFFLSLSKRRTSHEDG